MQAIQSRVDRKLDEMNKRLDSSQELRDQQRLQSWQVSKQVPDLNQRLDHLWSQCQIYFSKVKEHDAHIAVMSTRVDEQEQQALEVGGHQRSTKRPVERLQQHQQQRNQQLQNDLQEQQQKRLQKELQDLRLQRPQLPEALSLQDRYDADACSQEPPSPTSSLCISISSAGAFAPSSSHDTAASYSASRDHKHSTPTGLRPPDDNRAWTSKDEAKWCQKSERPLSEQMMDEIDAALQRGEEEDADTSLQLFGGYSRTCEWRLPWLL